MSSILDQNIKQCTFYAGDVNVSGKIIKPNGYQSQKCALQILSTSCTKGKVELELYSSDDKICENYRLSAGGNLCIVSRLERDTTLLSGLLVEFGLAKFEKVKISRAKFDGNHYCHILFFLRAKIFDDQNQLVEIQQSFPFLIVSKIKHGYQSFVHHKKVLEQKTKKTFFGYQRT